MEGSSMSRTLFPSRTRIVLVLVSTILAMVAVPATARAYVSESYKFNGWEYWATTTVGYFAGNARGSEGDPAAWEARIEHTVQTIPVGYITGGYAQLLSSDLTRVRGDFSGGKLRLIDEGAGSCGNLTHKVRGALVDVTRSDNGQVGTGLLVGRLIHYRVSILGICTAYAARAYGTIYLTF
jgi:hypothetical protein